MPEVLYIWFGAAFTVMTAWSAGRLLLVRLRLELTRLESNLLSFLLGGVILSLLMFALCVAHVVYKPVLLALGAVLMAFALRSRIELAPSKAIAWAHWQLALWILGFAAFGVYGFVHASAPENSPDGMAYHLGEVARYARARGFTPIGWNFYNALPQGLELLFLCAYVFGRHSAAALVHFAYLCALPPLLLAYGVRKGNPQAGAAAGLIVFASPVFLVTGASGYVDVALAAVLFGMFFLLEIHPRARIAIGLLAGYAFALKYTAGLGLLYALARTRHWRTGLAAACVMLPWLLRNWIEVRNPVAPFFNRLFPNELFTVEMERTYTEYLRLYSLTSFWQAIPEVTWHGAALGGLLGPVFLLAPLALFTRARAALLFGVILLLVYPLNIGTRFLIPAAPFIAYAMCDAIRWGAWPIAALHLILSWPPMITSYSNPYAWRVWEFPWEAALRLETEEAFLNNKSLAYITARMIEITVPPGGRVLCWASPAESHTSREIIVIHNSARAHRFIEGPDEEFLPRVRAAGIRYYLVWDGDPRAAETFAQQKELGIRLLAERGPSKLYDLLPGN
jgi:hypothetical protein